MSKVGRIVNVIAVALVVAYGIAEYIVPRVVLAVHKDEYQALMFQCDHVMREHFIAKQHVLVDPSDMAIKNLTTSEVGLLTCHDYDKLRKKLQSFGVSAPQLSMVGLEVMEEKLTDVRRFVETHEIRY
tara:strand:+ start:287 stop:670 length:384 start_codon:yes stop_codon:yes gene_type:complete